MDMSTVAPSDRNSHISYMVFDLNRPDLQERDTVQVSSAATQIGVPAEFGSSAAILNDAIRQCVGPKGTIVMLSFTPPSPF